MRERQPHHAGVARGARDHGASGRQGRTRRSLVTARLSRATLAEVLPRPGVRPAATGVVHLGVGAFPRAHQAIFTEDAALASGENRWGVLGVSQRSDRAVRALRPQDGLYGLLEVVGGEPSLRVCGSLTDVAYLCAETRVLGAIADARRHARRVGEGVSAHLDRRR